jgi:hypothetical protein
MVKHCKNWGGRYLSAHERTKVYTAAASGTKGKIRQGEGLKIKNIQNWMFFIYKP